MANPQNHTRLWWVAHYHDGDPVYESEQPGRVSSEIVDRANLARFSLVDADGVERFGLDFPAGSDDPRLVYRRRSFVGDATALPPAFIRDLSGHEVPNESAPEAIRGDARPAWLNWEWSYVVGRHYSDGRLELWGMDEHGSFSPESKALTCVTGHGEPFNDLITWSVDAWGPTIELRVNLDDTKLSVDVDGQDVTVNLPGEIIPPVVDNDGVEVEPERLLLSATASQVVAAVNATGVITGSESGNPSALVRPSSRERVSNIELVPCELF